MCKYFLLLILCVCIKVEAYSQEYDRVKLKAEIGATLGGSYYLGDINQTTHFYSPKLAYGILYRYSINGRVAFKGTATKVQLSGNDADFTNKFQQLRNKSFNISFFDFAAQVEINYLPVYPGEKENKFSPYLCGGLGMFIAPTLESTSFNFAIPFGFGVKYAVDDRLTLGAEWCFRKTFTDELDQINTDFNTEYGSAFMFKQKFFRNNYDLYSMAMVSVSYKFSGVNAACPAYR